MFRASQCNYCNNIIIIILELSYKNTDIFVLQQNALAYNNNK